MSDLWIHIGMPKAGSSAIQATLWNQFSDCSPMPWNPSDVRASLDGPQVLQQRVDSRVRPDRGSLDIPIALRWRRLTIASSEEYVFTGPNHLAGDSLTGMAVVREPVGWVLSAAGENLLRTFPLRPELTHSLPNSLDADDTDAQLDAVVRNSMTGYRVQLENVRAWCLGARWFDIAVYRPDINLVDALASSLRRHGCTIDHRAIAPRLRVTPPFVTAQLALTIFLTAVRDFSLKPNEAARLSQSALAVEPKLLQANLVALRPSAAERLTEEFRSDHARYEALLHEFGDGRSPVPFTPPQLNVIDRSFARQLASSAIRLALHRAIIPDGFDAGQYLASNPDLRAAALQSPNPEGFARHHYEQHGAFEARSAPVRQ